MVCLGRGRGRRGSSAGALSSVEQLLQDAGPLHAVRAVSVGVVCALGGVALLGRGVVRLGRARRGVVGPLGRGV